MQLLSYSMGILNCHYSNEIVFLQYMTSWVSFPDCIIHHQSERSLNYFFTLPMCHVRHSFSKTMQQTKKNTHGLLVFDYELNCFHFHLLIWFARNVDMVCCCIIYSNFYRKKTKKFELFENKWWGFMMKHPKCPNYNYVQSSIS